MQHGARGPAWIVVLDPGGAPDLVGGAEPDPLDLLGGEVPVHSPVWHTATLSLSLCVRECVNVVDGVLV